MLRQFCTPLPRERRGTRLADSSLRQSLWRARFARFWQQRGTVAPWVELREAAEAMLGELAADLPGVGMRLANAADRLALALLAVLLD